MGSRRDARRWPWPTRAAGAESLPSRVRERCFRGARYRSPAASPTRRPPLPAWPGEPVRQDERQAFTVIGPEAFVPDVDAVGVGDWHDAYFLAEASSG